MSSVELKLLGVDLAVLSRNGLHTDGNRNFYAHSTLFKDRWKNWAFGIFAMIPLIISFTSFKEDHLIHHRYNRTPKDPDAFTMGKRGVGDFILFNAYAIVGVVLATYIFWFFQ